MYYFIGIGGIGMSALAWILLEKGERVLGSDQKRSTITDELEAAGATIYTPQAAENIPSAAHVIITTAIKSDNPELMQAQKLGLKISHRSELLEKLSQGYRTLMVAGTHGKTSTTALLSHVLMESGLDPSYCIGGEVPSLPHHGHAGRGDYFVLEADESDGSFLRGCAEGAIVTNVDADHLDYWGSMEALEEAFSQFCAKSRSLVYCEDDPWLKKRAFQGIPYSAAQIISFCQNGGICEMSYQIQGRRFDGLQIRTIGFHQALNALAVMTLALEIGIEEGSIRKALATFRGVKRRAEYLGECDGVIYYDDYAHHPTEVRAIIAAFKKAFEGKRLVVLFQPHRYTRFNHCFDEFCHTFDGIDSLIATDIYGAGEENPEGLHVKSLCERLSGTHYCPWQDLQDFLDDFLKAGDVLLTLGAGTITNIGRMRVAKASALT